MAYRSLREFLGVLERQGELVWTLARLESEWLDVAERLQHLDAGG